MTDQTFYASFPSDNILGNTWVRIVAPDKDTAKQAMMKNFSHSWSTLYSDNIFLDKVIDYFPGGELVAFSVDELLNQKRI